jgi:hypothetical protein
MIAFSGLWNKSLTDFMSDFGGILWRVDVKTSK